MGGLDYGLWDVMTGDSISKRVRRVGPLST